MSSVFKKCVNSAGKFLRKNPSGHKIIKEKGILATSTLGKDRLSPILILGLAMRLLSFFFFLFYSNLLAIKSFFSTLYQKMLVGGFVH